MILFYGIFLYSTQAQIFKYIGMKKGPAWACPSTHNTQQGYMWILTHKGIERYNRQGNLYAIPYIKTIKPSIFILT